jgi:hypothetical protein
MFQISYPFFFLLRSFFQGIRPVPNLHVRFRNKLIFYGVDLLAPRPTPKLEDHPLSAVRDCLFNIFAATLHNWRVFPLSATWGRAMPWWQGTHLTWFLGTNWVQNVFPCKRTSNKHFSRLPLDYISGRSAKKWFKPVWRWGQMPPPWPCES